MSKHNTALDTSGHGYNMLFRDAVKATERAMRKRWGSKIEIPLLSHALSEYSNNTWSVSDIAGNPVAIVNSAGRAILIDDINEEEQDNGDT